MFGWRCPAGLFLAFLLFCLANSGESRDILNSNEFPVQNNSKFPISRYGSVLIGDNCGRNEDCVSFEEGSSQCSTESVTGVCVCKSEYVHSSSRNECLPIINTLDSSPCKENLQCHRGSPGSLSICTPKSNGSIELVCKCNTGAINNGSHHCIKKAELVGQACDLDIQCHDLAYSHCVNGLCLCDSEYIESSNHRLCLRPQELGGACIDPVQCIVNNSTCQFDTCTCVTGYASDGAKCHQKKIIDENCEIDAQCPVNSHCNSAEMKTCKCNNGYLPSASKSSCLKIATEFDEVCQEREQCLSLSPNATCADSDLTDGRDELKCICELETFVQSTKLPFTCLEIIRERYMNCSEDIQCTAGLGAAICKDNKCHCNTSYEYYEGNCYLPSKLGEVCKQTEECFVGINNLTMCEPTAEVNIKRCRCLPGTQPFGHPERCLHSGKKIGERCASNEECTVSIRGLVHCDLSTKTCLCQLGFIPSDSKKMCSGAGAVSQFNLFLNLLMLITIFVFGTKAI